MANNTNIMSIAPNQPTTPTRRISPSTQPKYKPTARAGKRTFGSTLDQVNMKLDELKQNIQDLQESSKKIAQVEGDEKTVDEANEISAQGKSNKPQDAEKAIGNEESGIENRELEIENNPEIAEEKIKPADIFFAEDKPSEAIKPFVKELPPKITDDVKLSVAEISTEATVPAAEPVNLDNSTDLLDEQSPANLLVASSVAYLFGVNKETLLSSKPAVTVEAPKVDAVPNLMSLMPQEDKNNSQSMLNLLGGKTWRQFEVEVQGKGKLDKGRIQLQSAEVQPSVQPQAVDVQPLQVQPSVQPQVAYIQPLQVQAGVQPQVAEIQPLQVQASVQPQVAEIQPLQVQPSVQPQVADVQQSQVQPSVQPQVAEVQPLQIQPSVQPQEIGFQPLEVQPSVQPQVAEVQPLQIQPSVQPQEIDFQPLEVQPSVQPQVAEVQPLQIQPSVQPQEIDFQPLEVQPSVQPQVAEVQPLQVQSNVQPQAVDVQQSQIQPSIQSQAVDFQPLEVQPSAQPQIAEVQPLQVQSNVQPQVVNVQSLQVQPSVQTAQIQPQIQAQPIITPQKVDERPSLQNFSELLGADVQVEDTPTTAPVTPPQSTPQQFNQEQQQQPQQRDTQNFQSPILQATTEAPQVQQATAGGEIFTVPLTTTTDVSQPQQPVQAQAPDAPPAPPQEDFDVPAQIVRQARLIRTTENTEMVIKLNPEHLGELTLRVSVSSTGAINASFHSDNAQVRTIIENSLVQLRQELNDQGLKVENVEVYAGLSDGGLMSGQGGQAWQQGRQQRQGNRQINLNSLERDADSTAPANENSVTEGVDYSV